VLPSGERIAEDVEVVLHGPSAVVLPQPGVPRKMHVHRQTGNSSIAGISKLLAPDRALLARHHTHAWLTPPLLVACATYCLRCAFPIRNGGSVPRGADAPRSWLHARRIAAGSRPPLLWQTNATAPALAIPTAGSRPPLLGACVCASRMSFFTANERRATGSGWRKPAVVR
jgi:hypothetical protein